MLVGEMVISLQHSYAKIEVHKKTEAHLHSNKSKMIQMEHMVKTTLSGPFQSKSLLKAVFKATAGSVLPDG